MAYSPWKLIEESSPFGPCKDDGLTTSLNWRQINEHTWPTWLLLINVFHDLLKSLIDQGDILFKPRCPWPWLYVVTSYTKDYYWAKTPYIENTHGISSRDYLTMVSYEEWIAQLHVLH
jgi:hypothetical protein